MSPKHKNNDIDTDAIPADAILDATPPPVDPTPAAVPTSNEPLLTIDAYLDAKGIQARHRAGMRAFTKAREATSRQWDEIFARY